MAKIAGAVGNIGVQREKLNMMLTKGEGVIGSDFEMEIEGFGTDNILVVSCQLPPLFREMIESFAPYGQRILQQGNWDSAFEMPISFKEVINGPIYQKIRDWIINKEHKTVKLKMIPESNPAGATSHSWLFHNCWIRLDGVDLTVEDRATLVKPAGTLHVHYFPDEN
jgi:hypothetical protein